MVKIIGAHAAIVSAFAGTVLPFWQPYSQLLPSVVWTVLQIAFVVQVVRRGGISERSPVANQLIAAPANTGTAASA
jgi:hypothetical protein